MYLTVQFIHGNDKHPMRFLYKTVKETVGLKTYF
jgi:hypothetical protein